MRHNTILCVFLLLSFNTGFSFRQERSEESSLAAQKDPNSSITSNGTVGDDFYYPSDRLEYIRRTIYEDTVNDAVIIRFEENVRKSIADGFAEPWQNLVPKLTREQCVKMPTPELAKVCFSTSLFTRLLLIYDRPVYAFSIAKIRYPCYEELFNRDNLWEGVLSAYSFYSSSLNPKGEPNDVIDAIMGLNNLPLFFQYPPMRRQLEGREVLFVRAHLEALKNIRSFIKDDKDNSTVSSTQFFSVTTPISLVNYSLVLLQKVSTDKSKSVIDNISKLRLSKTPEMKEVKKYIDICINEIEPFLDSYMSDRK